MKLADGVTVSAGLIFHCPLGIERCANVVLFFEFHGWLPSLLLISAFDRTALTCPQVGSVAYADMIFLRLPKARCWITRTVGTLLPTISATS